MPALGEVRNCKTESARAGRSLKLSTPSLLHSKNFESAPDPFAIKFQNPDLFQRPCRSLIIYVYYFKSFVWRVAAVFFDVVSRLFLNTPHSHIGVNTISHLCIVAQKYRHRFLASYALIQAGPE